MSNTQETGDTLQVQGTRILALTLEFLRSPNYKILVHQGGTRSGKTYGIAQALVVDQIDRYKRAERHRYTLVRQRMPSLKATAMRDYFDILHRHELYDDAYHNKTDFLYRFGGIEQEFLSLDDPQKVRGRKRDTLWLNEANELSYEAYKQLIWRTLGKTILDYNPSDEFSWIYDHVLPRDDVMYVESTYKDNPYLPAEVVREIERLKHTDENAWRVFGLGKRGSSGAQVFPSFEIVDEMPDPDDGDALTLTNMDEQVVSDEVFGVDFGFNSPSSVVRVIRVRGDREAGEPDELYAQCLLYETKLTTNDLIVKLHDITAGSYAPIYCDSSSPERVEELQRAGLNARPADKRRHSVKDGIDFCKRHKIYITADSEPMIREMRGYKWMQDKDERILDEPVKFMDHAVDAFRYAAYTHFGRPVEWLVV